MIYKVYSIFDRVAKEFSAPFVQRSPELARRQFFYLMAHSEMVCNDCDLYILGSFDSDTGCISAFDKPEFMCHYEEQ